MPSTYFLVFLLGLLPLSTLTSAEQNGGTTLDGQPFTDRFYLRNSRPKIQTHPSESVAKPPEKASPEDGMMQKTESVAEPLEKASPSEDGTTQKSESVAKTFKKVSPAEDGTTRKTKIKSSGGFEKFEEMGFGNENKGFPTGAKVSMKEFEKKTSGEDKHADCEKMREQKTEEEWKYKAAGSSSNAERNDFYDSEDV